MIPNAPDKETIKLQEDYFAIDLKKPIPRRSARGIDMIPNATGSAVVKREVTSVWIEVSAVEKAVVNVSLMFFTFFLNNIESVYMHIKVPSKKRKL